MKHNQFGRRLRILTWHVHGTYLYYLTQTDCDFYLPVAPDRSGGYGGRVGPFPWGDNVHEIPISEVSRHDFDAVLFQSRQHYEVDQHQLLSDRQHQLPKFYLEHDPPREHPTDTVHVTADDHAITVVHCTEFNRLMWDNRGVAATVIDHGVVAPPYLYNGSLERGVVIVNNLQSRGRRLGADIFQQVRRHVPLDLVGMGSKELGGLGEVPHNELPQFIAQYRFFFNPIRYTSMGLAIIEAMMTGLPVVGLATTELVSVIRNGVNGYLDLNPDQLVEHMKQLLDSPELARALGQEARATALQRFSIERFANDWETLFANAVAGRQPQTTYREHAHKIAIGNES